MMRMQLWQSLTFNLGQIRVERRLEFTRLPENWAAVITLGVVVGLCWWVLRTYRAEARAGVTLPARMLLASMRCLVILLLTSIWLEPVLATYLHRRIESYTLVLVDASASMNIKDYYSADEEARIPADYFEALGPPAEGGLDTPPPPFARSELVKLLLEGEQSAFLRGLTKHNRVKLFTFSDKTAELGILAAQRDEEDVSEIRTLSGAQLPEIEVGRSGLVTNPGLTLRHAVDTLDGRVAGVVIISDGGFNEGESAEALAGFARSRGIAVYAIGVGQSSPLPNIRVAELAAPANAFINDPFEIQARIEVVEMAGDTINLELFTDAGNGSGWTLLDSKNVDVLPGTSEYSVSFDHRSRQAGRASFRVVASGASSESVMQDNIARVAVNFLDRKMRVLLVASGPGWTYRFVSRLLERDDTFDVSCWLQSADRTAVRDGDTVIDHLPETAGELFEYDVIVLLDPDATQLPPDWAELLAQHVTRNGAGLMYCAARQQTPLFFHTPAVEPLIKLLPIVRHPEADLILNEIGYYQRSSSPVEFPRGALQHPVYSAGLTGEAAEQLAAKWRRLAQVYWHYPVRYEKAAATVLMRHGNARMRTSEGGHLLLATQFVGSGRSTFLGFDGTWRWRRFGESMFDRFWVQNIRYLAEGRLLAGQARGRIHTDRDRYDVGEPIVFRARLTDRDYQPLARQTVQLRVHRTEAGTGNGKGVSVEVRRIELQRDLIRSGWYNGQFVPARAGTYSASIRLEVDPETRGPKTGSNSITRQFEVLESDLEIRNPRMDRDQLITLARQSAGGAYFEISEALNLPARIPDRHETTTTKGSAEPVWDTGWMLALLVGLLCLEWALRKKWAML